MDKNSNSSGKNNRGRFGLRAGSALRRSQNKPNRTTTNPSEGGRKAFSFMGRGRPQLSPLKESVPSRSSSSSSARPQRPQRQQQVTFRDQSIGGNEILHFSGFSQVEIHDLEESFKLFDIYGEGYVQVGDLRNILEVLRQEQQQQQRQQEQEQKRQSSTIVSKFPHLNKLISRLSELSDEDTLDMDQYIQLMASTTIANSVALESNDNSNGEDDGSHHFAHVFELFDSTGKGYITVQDLERIAIELGEHDMTRGELQEMIDRACGGSDRVDSKVVGIEEFTKMMTMSLFPANETGELYGH